MCFNDFILDQDYFIFKHHQTRPVQFQHNRFIFLSWTKSRVKIDKIKQTTFFKQLGKAQRSSLHKLGLTVSLIQITGMNTNSKCNLDLHLQIWQPLVVNFLALGIHARQCKWELYMTNIWNDTSSVFRMTS